jgi:uncharacterized protein (DUF1786 family)
MLSLNQSLIVWIILRDFGEIVLKVLALDIGAGTEDVLLYDDAKENVENCIKLILPSPSQIFTAKIREATQLHRDVLIKGDIIGGGLFTSALKKHIKAGCRVVMFENAAYTVRNNLDDVRALGITIIKENQLRNFQGDTLILEEININQLKAFLTNFNEDFSNIDVVAIAVQDHGVCPKGMSNRRVRIQTIRELLEIDSRPEVLAFTEDELPSCFLRMKSAVAVSKRQLPNAEVILMDTALAAIVGCLQDPVVTKKERVLAVNVGNGHTMAAIIFKGHIVGLLEHHTHALNPQTIKRLLIDFVDGKLSDDAVFKDGGHGLFFLEDAPCFSKIDQIAVTGPNRNLLAQTNLPILFASPAGDVMMTGPIGLVEVVKKKFNTPID